jgi:hypothetical protein
MTGDAECAGVRSRAADELAHQVVDVISHKLNPTLRLPTIITSSAFGDRRDRRRRRRRREHQVRRALCLTQSMTLRVADHEAADTAASDLENVPITTIDV